MYSSFSISHSISFALTLSNLKSVTFLTVISYVFSSPFSAFTIMLNTNLSEYYNAIDRAALLTQSKDKNIVKWIRKLFN